MTSSSSANQTRMSKISPLRTLTFVLWTFSNSQAKCIDESCCFKAKVARSERSNRLFEHFKLDAWFMSCHIRHMARGPSGRVVIEVDPFLKRDLHSALAA